MTSILKTDEIQSQNGGAVVKMQTLKHPSSSGNNITLASDGSATIANGTLSAGSLGSSVALPFDGTTDAGRIIQIKETTSQETNTINQTWTVRWNFSITLKSSTSKILVHHTENSYTSNNNGYGVKIYRNDSVLNDSITTFPSGSNSALVFDTKVQDGSSNPHAIYGADAIYVISPLFFLDDVSSNFNAGDTVYYGNFYKKYASGGAVQIPPDTTSDGVLRTIIMEVQK